MSARLDQAAVWFLRAQERMALERAELAYRAPRAVSGTLRLPGVSGRFAKMFRRFAKTFGMWSGLQESYEPKFREFFSADGKMTGSGWRKLK